MSRNLDTFEKTVLAICFVMSFVLGFFDDIKGAYADTSDVKVCFTPGDRCDLRLISAIRSAHSTIEVQAYQLTSKPIQRALVGAYQSGVKVEIILDKSQLWSKREAPALYLSTFNVPIWIDNKVKIAHNKVIIIDGKEVITGSYNYSRAAQFSNAENMVIIQSK